jgi:hypothetical protein
MILTLTTLNHNGMTWHDVMYSANAAEPYYEYKPVDLNIKHISFSFVLHIQNKPPG